MTIKKCKICGTEFEAKSNRACYCSDECKAIGQKEINKRKNDKRKEYLKMKNKEWNDNNKEYRKELNKKWNDNNKEYRKELNKEYYDNNKEKRKKQFKENDENKREKNKGLGKILDKHGNPIIALGTSKEEQEYKYNIEETSKNKIDAFKDLFDDE